MVLTAGRIPGGNSSPTGSDRACSATLRFLESAVSTKYPANEPSTKKIETGIQKPAAADPVQTVIAPITTKSRNASQNTADYLLPLVPMVITVNMK